MTEPVRTIAIIGATSGLGRAAAGQLAHHGHRLILVGRDPARVQRPTRQLPAAVVVHVVTDLIHVLEVPLESGSERISAQITAEAVLALRAAISNGDFPEYWRFHLAREHQRLHPGTVPRDRRVAVTCPGVATSM